MKPKFIKIVILLLLSIGFSQQQERPLNEMLGAISEISLDHGMSIYVNFTQTRQELVYSTWFNNPEDYPYWESALCLAIIVGTPGLVGQDQDSNTCGFLPNFDAAGYKDPFGSQGEKCIKNQISVDPCRDNIQINNNCGNIMNVVPQFEFMASTRFKGLRRIKSTRLNVTDDIKLNPDWYKTIYKQSMLVAYTDQNDIRSPWRQTIKCSNIDLGNGTLEHFDRYPKYDDGSYDYSYFPSMSSLIQMNMSLILGAAVISLTAIFTN